MQRRERGEVPARFGGTREQGVRNTMSSVAPSGTAPTGMGSLRRGGDPLDRMPVRGGDEYNRQEERESGGRERRDMDKARERRMEAMDKPVAQPSAVPVA